MNILPKKRWHVRTRENIARVRKDEQEATKECEDKKQRILKAEQEARTSLLRQRARSKYRISEDSSYVDEQSSKPKESCYDRHVNFFEEIEEGKIVITKTNADAEIEEKEKREKYEKQIGYLTYLGQDTVESTGNIPWYDKVPSRFVSRKDPDGEKSSKTKLLHDPLSIMKKYISPETKSIGDTKSIGESSNKISQLEYQSIFKREDSKKRKKHKKKSKKCKKRISICSSSSSEDNGSDYGGSKKKLQYTKSLEQLRAERLKREKEERERTEQLLARLQGKEVEEQDKEPKTIMQQKYNSQYNPELAKQNFLNYANNK